MKKMLQLLCLWVLFLFVAGAAVPVQAYQVYKDDNVSFKAGFWGQVWYQTVGNAQGTDNNRGIYDFEIRRAYFYAKADFMKKITLFTHLAGDRLYQDNLHERPSLGLESNLVFRDWWANFNFFDDAFKVQMGRMYIPFTRNYGTTSTKALLNLDLDWGQGGVRSGIFYPSRVGRDDGVTFWGNVIEKKLQYRFMFAKGVYDDDLNPGDHPRFAGRVSWAFWEPETGWFNQGTYLGKKKILTVGMGFDHEANLRTGTDGRKQDYTAWTMDIHWDQPMGEWGACTAEAAIIHINNSVNGITYTGLTRGGDATIYSFKAGHLLPWKIFVGQLQPNVHINRIDPEAGDGTTVMGVGVNYFFKGHANKIAMDLTVVDQDDNVVNQKNHTIFTLQLALGF